MNEQKPRRSTSSSSTWPGFLEVIDTDPDRSFAEFYEFAVTALTITPPRSLQGFHESERLDLIHKVVYHCVDQHFRVLRTYQDKGRPFAGWLYVTANNKCLEELRKQSRSRETVSLHSEGENPGVEDLAADPADGIDSTAERIDLLGKVVRSLEEMDRKCRLLLQMAADEFSIAEMVTVLRLPKDQNAKVSDSLRYCRKKLYKLMASKGIEVVF